MTEATRGRGRPKKVTIAPTNAPEKETVFTSFEELRDYLKKEGVVIEDEPKNPDCEHATKGYVKCIARQVFYHNHEQNVNNLASTLAAIMGWLCFAGTLIGFGTGPSAMPFGWYPASTVALAFSIACTIMTYELGQIGSMKTSRIDDEMARKTIKKYEPPKCEKKECE